MAVHVGYGGRAPDIEDVGAGTEVEIQGIDAVVVHAIGPVSHGDVAGDIEIHGVGPQAALEIDDELIAQLLGESVAIAEQAPESGGEIIGGGVPSQDFRRRSAVSQGIGAAGGVDAEADGVVHHGEHGSHLKAGQRGLRQPARAAHRVAALIEVDRVVPRTAIEGEKALDIVKRSTGRRSKRTNVDRVVTITAEDRGVTGDRPHVDGIVAIIAMNNRPSLVRALNGEGIATRAQLDNDLLELEISQTGGESHAGDDLVIRQTEPNKPFRCQDPHPAARGTGVSDHNTINLKILIHGQVDIAHVRQRTGDFTRQAHARLKVRHTVAQTAFDEQGALDVGEIPRGRESVCRRAGDFAVSVHHGDFNGTRITA